MAWAPFINDRRTPPVARVQLGGGGGWMLGLLTRFASAGIACRMIVAICRHAFVKGDPFLGGYELATAYLYIAILLATVGPGRFALDRWLL